MFQEPLKVRVNKEEGTVSLSIRETDNKVSVYTFSLPVFQLMVALFQADLEGDE